MLIGELMFSVVLAALIFETEIALISMFVTIFIWASAQWTVD
jgi:hypothetical protein